MTLKPPIFIGCLPKSGASLLRTMVGRHPNIFGGDGFETHWFSDEIVGRYQDPTTRRQIWMREWFQVDDAEYGTLQAQATSGVDFFDRFMAFCALRESKGRWLEKTPDNLYHYHAIIQFWPEAQFIHVVREYKDMYASWKGKNTGSLNSLDVHEFVKKVKDSYQQIDHLLGTRTPHYMEAKYEELVTVPKKVVMDAVGFLGEPWIEGMENYGGDSEEFDKVKRIMGRESNTSRSLQRPIFTSSVGQWPQILDAEEVAVIDSELGDLRHRLGYAQSSSA